MIFVEVSKKSVAIATTLEDPDNLVKIIFELDHKRQLWKKLHVLDSNG